MLCGQDAVLHPALPLLVWLMCAAAKGHRLSGAQQHACLRIVADLAAVPFQDHLPGAGALNEHP